MNLTKFAKIDLTIARKEGRLAVAQTKKGTLWIEYVGRTYTFTSNNGEVLFKGAAKGATEFLVENYVVIQTA